MLLKYKTCILFVSYFVEKWGIRQKPKEKYTIQVADIQNIYTN